MVSSSARQRGDGRFSGLFQARAGFHVVSSGIRGLNPVERTVGRWLNTEHCLSLQYLGDGFLQHVSALEESGFFFGPEFHFDVTFDTGAAHDGGD